MARIVLHQLTYPEHHRISTIWHEGGLEFRSNVFTQVGASIPLHWHTFDHVALITHGHFRCVMVSPDGETEVCELASKEMQAPNSAGYKLLIRAHYRHQFTLLAHHPPLSAEILCILVSQEGG